MVRRCLACLLLTACSDASSWGVMGPGSSASGSGSSGGSSGSTSGSSASGSSSSGGSGSGGSGGSSGQGSSSGATSSSGSGSTGSSGSGSRGPRGTPGAGYTCPAVTGSQTMVSTGSALQAAMTAAKAGDVIVVAPGMYQGDFQGTAAGTASAPIVVMGQDPTHPPVLVWHVVHRVAVHPRRQLLANPEPRAHRRAQGNPVRRRSK